MYRDLSVAIAPDSGGLWVLHVTPVLPPQGFGVFDTCVIGRLPVPFMSPAIRTPAFWFLSIWNAWPPSTKYSDNNSTAPIESRAEFLYMMHLLLVGRVDPCLPMLISNQRASRFCSRLSHSYPLICWNYLARMSRSMPLRVRQHSTQNRIEFDYDGIRMDADEDRYLVCLVCLVFLVERN